MLSFLLSTQNSCVLFLFATNHTSSTFSYYQEVDKKTNLSVRIRKTLIIIDDFYWTLIRPLQRISSPICSRLFIIKVLSLFIIDRFEKNKKNLNSNETRALLDLFDHLPPKTRRRVPLISEFHRL